jgi:bacillithiol system protein YtxJ
MAFNRVQKEANAINEKFNFYLIDVVANRNLSQQLASELDVEHESPQVIVVNEGKVIFHTSHMAISPQSLLSLV